MSTLPTWVQVGSVLATICCSKSRVGAGGASPLAAYSYQRPHTAFAGVPPHNKRRLVQGLPNLLERRDKDDEHGITKSFSVMTDIWQLEQGGFSSDEIAGLLRVKALYQRGVYDETDSEQNRLAFVRWLYVQGRLES